MTKTISGDKYSTASLVIPLVNELKGLTMKIGQTDFLPSVICGYEKSQTLSSCTFIDPHFVILGFSNEKFETTEQAKIQVKFDLSPKSESNTQI